MSPRLLPNFDPQPSSLIMERIPVVRCRKRLEQTGNGWGHAFVRCVGRGPEGVPARGLAVDQREGVHLEHRLEEGQNGVVSEHVRF